MTVIMELACFIGDLYDRNIYLILFAMQQILIVNDCTPQAEHAAKFALTIAQKTRVDILLANTLPVRAMAKVPHDDGDDHVSQNPLLDELIEINDCQNDFRPVIYEMDISGMSEVQLAEFIHTKGISLIVKGEQEFFGDPELPHLNIQPVLNKVCCPLLLVPVQWPIKDIAHIVYLADLRYCRTPIVNYLVNLARAFNADISITHFSAKGLPDMDQQYATEMFENVQQYVHYDPLFLNNTRERDMKKAVDVLINGMHNDLLVVVNHRYHFEEILGRYITDMMPENITVPVLVFPY